MPLVDDVWICGWCGTKLTDEQPPHPCRVATKSDVEVCIATWLRVKHPDLLAVANEIADGLWRPAERQR